MPMMRAYLIMCSRCEMESTLTWPREAAYAGYRLNRRDAERMARAIGWQPHAGDWLCLRCAILEQGLARGAAVQEAGR